MIDEQGRIARRDEGAYTRTYKAGNLSFGTDEYLPALRDWVVNGGGSKVVFEQREMAERLNRRSSRQSEADAHFRLASFFQETGQQEPAEEHWRAAQRLDPDSWNYHRQEWSYTPAEHGAKWFAKFQELGDKPYYAPIEMPKKEQKP